MRTNGTVPTIVMTTPTSAVTPPPTRSVTRPEMPIAIAAPTPCGMSRRPVWTASSPRTVWKYSGMRIIAPKSAAPRQNVVKAAERRPEDRREDDRHADEAHEPRQRARAGRLHEDDLADGHHEPAADAL